MLADQFTTAIAGAHPRALDDLAGTLWKAHAGGLLDDGEAQRLAEAIEARRAVSRVRQSTPGLVRGRPSFFRPRRSQLARLHPERIARRRRLAASGPLPPQLAAQFTTGELAVLRIVGEEARQKGACSCSLAELAARAGVCRSLAQATIRHAARLGLIAIEERKRKHQPHLPNVLRVVCREWSAWLKLGSKGTGKGGSKFSAPTDKPYEKGRRETASERQRMALEEGRESLSPPT